MTFNEAGPPSDANSAVAARGDERVASPARAKTPVIVSILVGILLGLVLGVALVVALVVTFRSSSTPGVVTSTAGVRMVVNTALALPVAMVVIGVVLALRGKRAFGTILMVGAGTIVLGLVCAAILVAVAAFSFLR